MNRFDSLTEGRKILACGVVAGDPYLEATVEHMIAIDEAGADVIELIYPFSTPMFHGRVIQRACTRALKEPVGLSDVAHVVRTVREKGVEAPIIVSSYANRILREGTDRFVASLADAGADAIWTPDIPFEEAESIRKSCASHGLFAIRSVASTTSRKRRTKILQAAEGVVFWQAQRAESEEPNAAELIDELTEAKSEAGAIPFLAAMHVGTPEEAAFASQGGDGVIVTSSLVWLIEGRGPDVNERIAQFVGDLRRAIDA